MECIKENKEELEAFTNLSLAQMEALVEEKKQQQRDSKQFKQIVKDSITVIEGVIKEADATIASVDVVRAIAEEYGITLKAKKAQTQALEKKQDQEAERIVAEKTEAEQPVEPNAKEQKQMDRERRRKEFADDIKTKHNIDIDPSEFTFKSLKQILQTGLIQEKKGSKKYPKILEYGKTHENQKFKLNTILPLLDSARYRNHYTFVGSTKGLLRNPPLKAYLNKKGYSIVFGSNSDNDMSDGEYKIIKL